MPLVISNDPVPATVEREVKGPFGSFFISIKTPGIPERHKARSLVYTNIEERPRYLLTFVCGWRDVLDKDGQPIPFRQSSQVLGTNGSVLHAVVLTVADFFDEDLSVLTEEEEKNSEVPRGNTDAA